MARRHLGTLALVLAAAMLASASARAQERVQVMHNGGAAGFALAVETPGRDTQFLCEPDCAIEVPIGALRLGWRRGDEIEWQRTLEAREDLLLEVRTDDRSLERNVGYGLLIAGSVLLAAAVITGIATEPHPARSGWFGERHGLVFAAIAGGIALSFGAPGVGIAVAYERDGHELAITPAQ